jgi:two-component system phosphate regulon sensor histidine kinase PhoR
MARKFSFAILLAVLTGLGIIVAQSYWIVRTYKAREINFIRDASGALQYVVFQSMIGSQLGTGSQKQTNDSSHNVNHAERRSANPAADKTIRLNIDVIDSPSQSIPNSLPLTIAIPTNAPNVIGPVKININDRQFQQLLRQSLVQSKIDIPFRLFITSPDSIHKNQYLVSVAFKTPNAVTKHVVMDFPGLTAFLLKTMLAELLLSVGIIVIAFISFAYLLKTIFRQKQFAEMKNDFISNITHELKTPVAIMMATNEALLQFNAMDDKEKTKRYLGINQDELHKLQAILDNIGTSFLDEHPGHTLQLKATDIDALLKKIIHRFSSLDGVTLHFKNNLENNIIQTHEEALETIVTNLVDNAIKYNNELRKQVWIDCTLVGKHISITVKDDGQGMEKKYLPFVFDKFYRIPKGNLHEVKGFGLGLKQVKQLVEKLHGTIAVQSEPGKGTTFTINLPLHEQD